MREYNNLQKIFNNLCDLESNKLGSRIALEEEQSHIPDPIIIAIKGINADINKLENELISCKEHWNNKEEAKALSRLHSAKESFIEHIESEVEDLCKEYNLEKLYFISTRGERSEYQKASNALNSKVSSVLKAINDFSKYYRENQDKDFWYTFDSNKLDILNSIDFNIIANTKANVLAKIKEFINQKAQGTILKLANKFKGTVFKDLVNKNKANGFIGLWQEQSYKDEEYYSLTTNKFGSGNEFFKIDEVDEKLKGKFDKASQDFLVKIQSLKESHDTDIKKSFDKLESEHDKRHKSSLKELKELLSYTKALDSTYITRKIVDVLPGVIFILEDGWEELDDEHYREYKEDFKKLFNTEITDNENLLEFVKKFNEKLELHREAEYQDDIFKDFISHTIEVLKPQIKKRIEEFKADTKKSKLLELYNQVISSFEDYEAKANSFSTEGSWRDAKGKFQSDKAEFEQKKTELEEKAIEAYESKLTLGLAKYFTLAMKKSFSIFDIDSIQFGGSNMLGGSSRGQINALPGSTESSEQEQFEEGSGTDFSGFFKPNFGQEKPVERLELGGSKALLKFSSNALEEIEDKLQDKDYVSLVNADLSKNLQELFTFIADCLQGHIDRYKLEIKGYKDYFKQLNQVQRKLFESLSHATSRKSTFDKIVKSFTEFLSEHSDLLSSEDISQDIFTNAFKDAMQEIDELLSSNESKLDDKITEAVLGASENIYTKQINYFQGNSEIASDLSNIFEVYREFLLKLKVAIEGKIFALQNERYNPNYVVIKENWDKDFKLTCSASKSKIQVINFGTLPSFKSSNTAYREYEHELEKAVLLQEIERLQSILDNFKSSINGYKSYYFSALNEISKNSETDTIVTVFYLLYALWFKNKGDIDSFLQKVRALGDDYRVISKKLLDEKSLIELIGKLEESVDYSSILNYNLKSLFTKNIEDFTSDIDADSNLSLAEIAEDIYSENLTKQDFWESYKEVVKNRKETLFNDLKAIELNAWKVNILPKITAKYAEVAYLKIKESAELSLTMEYESYVSYCNDENLKNKAVDFAKKLKDLRRSKDKVALRDKAKEEFNKINDECISRHDAYSGKELLISQTNYSIEIYNNRLSAWITSYTQNDIKVDQELIKQNIADSSLSLNQELSEFLNQKKQDLSVAHEEFLSAYSIRIQSIATSLKVTPLFNITKDFSIILNDIINRLSDKEQKILKWKGSLKEVSHQVNKLAEFIVNSCRKGSEIMLYKEQIIPDIINLIDSYINLLLEKAKYDTFYEYCKEFYNNIVMLIDDFDGKCLIELRDILGIFNLKNIAAWQHFIASYEEAAQEYFEYGHSGMLTCEDMIFEERCDEITDELIEHWGNYHYNVLCKESQYIKYSKIFSKENSDAILCSIVDAIQRIEISDHQFIQLTDEEKKKRFNSYIDSISAKLNDYFDDIGVIS